MNSLTSWYKPRRGEPMRELREQLDRDERPSAVLPLVMWQGMEEGDESLHRRVAAERAQLPRNVALVVACTASARPVIEGVIWVAFPPRLLHLLDPTRKVQFAVTDAGDVEVRAPRSRISYSGRGAGKSWAFARALILRVLMEPILVLCCREYQGSILESVHRLLSSQIEALGLGAWFTVLQTSISSVNGSEFIFAGLHHNVSKIKSMEGIKICWVEEAEKVSEDSWQTLIPTMRKNSEIWVTFNPNAESDPTYQRFVTSPPPGALVQFVTWRDNPFFPSELVIEKDYLQRVDPGAYAHVWEGATRAASDAQIFRGKYSIEPFEPVLPAAAGEQRALEAPKPWDGPYLGADWGFAQDPTTLVKCWIADRKLYIEHECYAVGCDIDKTPALFDQVPGAARTTMRADSARPETISYMQQHGYGNCVSVEKWPGSVEDGIAHLRSYEQIVVHPRCKHTAEELRLYSYKTDRLTGDIKPEPMDSNNHTIDAIRYALQPLIRHVNTGYLIFMQREVEAMNERKRREPETAPSDRVNDFLQKFQLTSPS